MANASRRTSTPLSGIKRLRHSTVAGSVGSGVGATTGASPLWTTWARSAISGATATAPSSTAFDTPVTHAAEARTRPSNVPAEVSAWGRWVWSVRRSGAGYRAAVRSWKKTVASEKWKWTRSGWISCFNAATRRHSVAISSKSPARSASWNGKR